jgi:endogenous inhibitor of DNA gyrase (YacG/DUF329 family)
MEQVRCLVCQREMTGERSAWPQFPFCSRRCKLIDLGRWLGERYGVPLESGPPAEGEPSEEEEVPPAGQSSGRLS